MEVATAAVLFIYGAVLGSFACAQVWRIRAHQLRTDDSTQLTKQERAEKKRLATLARSPKTDRSACLSCRHPLAWQDLLPVVSWLWLRGKCRYCGKPIGTTELFAEVGLGVVFAVSYLAWPLPLQEAGAIVLLCLWLLACVVMAVLLIYDAKWFLLPFWLNCGVIAIGGVYAIVNMAHAGWQWSDVGSVVAAIAILGGLYGLFGLAGWSGIGDSILGVGLALFLGTWQLALVCIFLANLFGSLALIPLAMRQKIRKGLHIPFGPFLILGAWIALLWGEQLIDWFFYSSYL